MLHEIAHNTLYLKSATPFNESFAQLAGYRAAEAFFRRRGSEAAAQQAADRWLDEVVLSGYYTTLADRLDALYRVAPDSAAVVDSGRAALGRWAREQLEGTVGRQLPHLHHRPDGRSAGQQRAAWWRRGSTAPGWSCSRSGTSATARTSGPRWPRSIPSMQGVEGTAPLRVWPRPWPRRAPGDPGT